MNRRGFLSSMLRAGVGAAILPAAVTYGRRWIKPASSGRTLWLLDWDTIEPYWIQTTRHSFVYDAAYEEAWKCVMVDPPASTTLKSYTWTA